MQYNHPNGASAPLRPVNTEGALNLPPSSPTRTVAGLTQRELDVSQDLFSLMQRVVGWREDAQGPSRALVEKIHYLFDLSATLHAVGAPPRLVAEAVLHPVVSPEGERGNGDERRSLLKRYLTMRLQERPFLMAENNLSQVPYGTISYDMPPSTHASRPDWKMVRQEITSPVIEKLSQELDFRPIYSDDQLVFMREGLRFSLESLSDLIEGPHSGAHEARASWGILMDRMEIGLLLLSTHKSPEVVVAGLLHDIRETTSPESWPEKRREIEASFGPKVATLVDLFGVSPVAQRTHVSGADRGVFDKPLLAERVERVEPNLRGDAEALVSAKAAHVMGRDLMSDMPLVRGVVLPLRGIPDPLGTGLSDWAVLEWGQRLSTFSAYCDVIYSDKTFRPMFDRIMRTWASGPKFLSGATQLMTAREAFGSLFPRSYESKRSLLDSLPFVHRVVKQALGASSQEKASTNLIVGYLTEGGTKDRADEAMKHMQVFEDGMLANKGRAPQITVQLPQKTHSEVEREYVTRGVDLLADFLEKGKFKDMVRDPVDQMKHASEVGFLLMRAGAPTDVVIAGLLHDIYELTPTKDLDSMKKRVVETFGSLGQRIDELIDVVTEPPKKAEDAHENYIIRKTKVIANLVSLAERDRALARDASNVICASKISTMRDGYHFGSDFSKVQPWTKGSWSENLRAMCALHDMFERLGTSHQFLGSYREEIRTWADLTRTMLPSVAPRHDQAAQPHQQAITWKDGVPHFPNESKEVSQSLSDLYLAVKRFHRVALTDNGSDVCALLEKAKVFIPNISEHVTVSNPEKASQIQLGSLINAVGRDVFLPRGLYLFCRIVDNSCEVVSGIVESSNIRSLSYLGKEITVSNLQFEHGVKNLQEVSAAIDGRILIDPALSAAHVVRLIDNLEERVREGDLLAYRIIETIVRHKLTSEDVERVHGYERHLFQQIATVEDTRYLELLAGPGNFRLNDTSYAMDLVKGNDTVPWLMQPQGNILVHQYSATLGGLTRQLEHYMEREDLVSAKLCFQCAYSTSCSIATRPVTTPMAVLFQPPAQLLVDKLTESLGLLFLEREMFADDAWEADVRKVVRAVQQIYYTEFYNARERAELIAQSDQWQGRPTHQAVQAMLVS